MRKFIKLHRRDYGKMTPILVNIDHVTYIDNHYVELSTAQEGIGSLFVQESLEEIENILKGDT